MKKLLLAVPLVMLAPLALSLYGRQQAPPNTNAQIGFVNSQRLLSESGEGRALLAEIQTMQQQKAADLRTLQQGLDATRQQLAAATDAPVRTQLQAKEQQQRTELERATAQAQTDFQALQRQANIQLQTRVRAVLDEVLKEKNMQMVVLDTSVVWARPEVDLTSAVIAALNMSRPAAPAGAK
jgi:Skp family chaperone for outer membrane proteins